MVLFFFCLLFPLFASSQSDTQPTVQDLIDLLSKNPQVLYDPQFHNHIRTLYVSSLTQLGLSKEDALSLWDDCSFPFKNSQKPLKDLNSEDFAQNYSKTFESLGISKKELQSIFTPLDSNSPLSPEQFQNLLSTMENSLSSESSSISGKNKNSESVPRN